jgi:hypothetical protein
MRFCAWIAAVLASTGLAFASTGALGAETWPPADPAEGATKVELDAAFAMKLRAAKSFGELQQAAGARGRITEIVRNGDAPHVVYSWMHDAKGGHMRVLLYRDGAFAAVVNPADLEGDIVLNSFGAFVCPSCSPPVNSCGHRPSWVPHDIHWDVFDCGCTLTGPQSLTSGSC